jgi:hypothetical protein
VGLALTSLQRAAVAVIVAVTLLVAYWVEHAPNPAGGDTVTLVQGARVAVRCLEHGTFERCGRREPKPPLPTSSTAVGYYPLMQYLPAGAMIELGASNRQTLTGLALINTAAFLGLLALFLFVARRRSSPAMGAVLMLVALTGPLLWYGDSTFGEMLAAFLTALFVVVVLLRPPWWAIAVALLAAGTTRETALPFLVALGLIALYGCPPRAPRPRTQLVGIAVGAAASLATTALFNVFRFGEIGNADYLQSAYRTPGLRLKLEYFGALLAAPNGGLLAFWTVAAVVLVGVAVIGVHRLVTRRGIGEWWPALALVLTFLGVVAGLASWYSPFGWFAWGPRLLIPWIPALVLLGLVAYAPVLVPALATTTRTGLRMAVTAAVVTALALPHVGVLWRSEAYSDLFLIPDPPCVPIDRLFNPPCLLHRAWDRPPVLVQAYRGLTDPPGILYGAALAVAVTALLDILRRSAPRRAAERGVGVPDRSVPVDVPGP